MATTTYAESDAGKDTSLSRHFLSNESDGESDGFKSRVKQAMGEEKARAFARKAGISESVLRQYIKGESLPTLDKLIAIADTARVNLLWLATGEGPMRGECVDSAAPCAGHVNVDTLTRALMLVEVMGAGLPVERKARVAAGIYELFAKEGQLLDADAIRQVAELLI